MDMLEFRLLNDFQRGFPLAARPYREIAGRLGCGEADVLAAVARLREQGKVSRIGAVFRPNTVNASLLAALRVPERRLEEVAAQVSARGEVSHNYARLHRWNLWFVAAARNDAALADLLDDIERDTGCSMLRLPLIESYHIDLGFDLDGGIGAPRRTQAPRAQRLALSPAQAALAAALAGGLPLAPQPYASIAERAGMETDDALAQIERWLTEGAMTRLGIVVRHHELGFNANAMVSWDVPDSLAADAGRRIARMDFVTLCALRARSRPEWPYNLYCMIHGRDAERVLSQIETLREHCGVLQWPFAVLFSRRRYKQQAARLPAEAAHG